MDQFKIDVTTKAHEDIADCVFFVMRVSKEAALALTTTIYSSLATLNSFPERNPVFEMPKHFPFIVRKHIIDKRYVALYSIEKDKVIIYRVIDTRKKCEYLLVK